MSVAQRPGDDRAEAAHGEDAVDGQARAAEVGPVGLGFQKRLDVR